MERDAILTLDDMALSRLVKLEFTRGSGNGGQKRNKTSTAVRVVLPEYGVEASDCTERSQHRNRAAALHPELRIALDESGVGAIENVGFEPDQAVAAYLAGELF